jgi:cysteine desulfurase / selenocysteine lyase
VLFENQSSTTKNFTMNLKKVRQETPHCLSQIHLNNAGASLPPTVVTHAMTEYLEKEAEIGGYELAELRQNALLAFYDEAAKLLNTNALNIALAGSATDAYNKALSSIPFKKGDVILTTDDDYISNQITFLSLQKRFGIEIVRGGNRPAGDLDLMSFKQLMLKYKPILVAVTHIPTNSGLIQPVEAVGKLCREMNIWYLVDACQSVGQIAVDVQKIQCDFLTTTARKFLRGPRGIGFLYASDRVLKAGLEPLFLDMSGADWVADNEYRTKPSARRFELWENANANVVGLTEALRYLNQFNINEIERINVQNGAMMRQLLNKIEGVRVLDQGVRLGSIVTFAVEGITPEAMKALLKQHNLNFSMSFRNFALLDYNKKEVDWAIRFSPHYYNTQMELETAAKAVQFALESKMQTV